MSNKMKQKEVEQIGPAKQELTPDLAMVNLQFLDRVSYTNSERQAMDALTTVLRGYINQ